MTPAIIIATYQRIEAERGGIAEAEVTDCVAATAKECGVTYEEVRAILSEQWSRPGG